MYQEIEAWLNVVLEQDIPSSVAAFGFNLYEDGNNAWSMELVGTESFDPENEDWICEEVTDFETRDDPFAWEQEAGWEEILEEVILVLKEYLENGLYADLLKSRCGVGVGFVDGDVEIVYEEAGNI